MDKVVIVEVFDFVNFHVCKALLDKGIKVRGVQIESEKNEEILDEKRLEIGRNANFNEISIREITNDFIEKETLILSVYDLYMRYKEDLLEKLDFINLDKWEHLVILVPSQLLTKSIVSEAESIINDFLLKINAMNKEIHLLYLPTIYGPWQPETFKFQHTILTDMNRGKAFRGLREETSDALFVEDTVDSIIEIMENKMLGKYLLRSGKSNQWDLCALFLQINEQGLNDRKKEIMEDNITKLTVNSTVPISVALQKQIDHTQRLYT